MCLIIIQKLCHNTKHEMNIYLYLLKNLRSEENDFRGHGPSKSFVIREYLNWYLLYQSTNFPLSGRYIKIIPVSVAISSKKIPSRGKTVNAYLMLMRIVMMLVFLLKCFSTLSPFQYQIKECQETRQLYQAIAFHQKAIKTIICYYRLYRKSFKTSNLLTRA